jgi:hypothetical protein
MEKSQAQNLRFDFYDRLDKMYHQFLDEIAQSNLGDAEMGRVAQIVMLSRQEGLKHLVSLEEMKAYYEQYPQEE